jgi:hypothetical protein
VLALKEWHVVCEAIARGDQVLTLRKGGIREKEFAVEGARFWLFPGWEHENAAELKRAWHGELSRSQREQPPDSRIPIRARCTVVEAWELADAAAVAALDPFHPWTPEYAVQRLRWRPSKPLIALLLRAEALVEPVMLAPSEAYGGCRSWVEIDADPPVDQLLPSLTDEAFALFSGAVRDALAGAGAALQK